MNEKMDCHCQTWGFLRKIIFGSSFFEQIEGINHLVSEEGPKVGWLLRTLIDNDLFIREMSETPFPQDNILNLPNS